MKRQCAVPWCQAEPVVHMTVEAATSSDREAPLTSVWVWFCREHGPDLGDDR